MYIYVHLRVFHRICDSKYNFVKKKRNHQNHKYDTLNL